MKVTVVVPPSAYRIAKKIQKLLSSALPGVEMTTEFREGEKAIIAYRDEDGSRSFIVFNNANLVDYELILIISSILESISKSSKSMDTKEVISTVAMS